MNTVWKISFKAALVLCLMFSLQACGDDDDDVEAPAADVGHDTNQGTPDASEQPDVGTPDEDTGAEVDTGPVERRLLASLRYRNMPPGCVSANCGTAVSISYLAGTIARTRENFSSGPSQRLSDEDLIRLDDVLFSNEVVLDKMQNGWNCPDVPEEETDETTYRFDIEIWGGTIYEQELLDVTGCFHADDANVLEIIALFYELRDDYFQD